MNKKLEIKLEVAGFFKFEVTRPDGSKKILADWFPNLITTFGLNRIGVGSIIYNCQIGSGSTAPAVTDTVLANRFATSATRLSGNGAGVQSSAAPWYGGVAQTFRFNAGVGTGNISEVGIGIDSPVTAVGNLFSRALVLDSGGSPTTITVLSDEILDVYYELRIYAPTVDTTGTVTISGTNYNVTCRASGANQWGSTLTYDVSVYGLPGSVYPNNWEFYATGALGAITGVPSGVSIGSATGGWAAYSQGSFKLDFGVQLGLSTGNNAAGLKHARITHKLGAFQFEFSPPIPKTANQVLNLGGFISWARKAI